MIVKSGRHGTEEMDMLYFVYVVLQTFKVAVANILKRNVLKFIQRHVACCSSVSLHQLAQPC
jgi:hypothetical protein